MAISGKFVADFSSFEAAVQRADVTLKGFEGDANKVTKSLTAMSNSLNGTKLIQDATLMARAVEKIGGVSKLTENELQRLGAQAKEAADKLTRMGEKVPANLIAIADAAEKVRLQRIADEAAKTATAAKALQSSGLETWFGNLSSQLLATAGGFISAQAVIGGVSRAFNTFTGFIRDSVKAFADAEAAQKKLTTALQAQGTATPTIIGQYNDLAAQFQRTTVFSDDLITSMEGLLVQVGNVMPNAMRGALKASTDLAAGLGIDLETATTLVAKAAAGHTETLGRYGIKVDQAKLATEGFSAVLEAINRQFGGQATAQLDTYAGRIEKLKNDWNNLQEAVGGAIANDPLVARGLREIGEAAAHAGESHLGLSNALKGIYERIPLVGPLLVPLIAHYEELARATNEAAAAQERLKAAQFAPVPSHLQPFEPAISHGIDPGFVEGLRQGSDAMDALHEAFQKFKADKAEEELKRQEAEWKAWAKSVDDATVNVNLGVFTLNRYHKELDDVHSSLDAVRDQFENWIAPLESVEVGIKLTADQLEGLQRAGRFAEAAMADLNAQLLKLPNVRSSLEGVDTEIHAAAVSLDGLSSAFAELAQISGGTLSGIARGMGSLIATFNTAQKAIESIGKSFLSFANGAAGFIGAFLQLGAVINQLTGPIDNATTHLRDLVKTLGASGESLASFVQRAHDAGISLDALFHAKNAQAFQTELQKVQDQLARIGQAGADAAKEIEDAIHATGARSNTELQHAADVARKAFEQALASGDYTQENLDKLYRAFQQALADAGSEAAKAWLKAHDAVASTSAAVNSELQKLIDRRDELSKGISQEAPEEQIGVIEQQMRAERDRIDQQIAAAQQAAAVTVDAQADAAQKASDAWKTGTSDWTGYQQSQVVEAGAATTSVFSTAATKMKDDFTTAAHDAAAAVSTTFKDFPTVTIPTAFQTPDFTPPSVPTTTLPTAWAVTLPTLPDIPPVPLETRWVITDPVVPSVPVVTIPTAWQIPATPTVSLDVVHIPTTFDVPVDQFTATVRDAADVATVTFALAATTTTKNFTVAAQAMRDEFVTAAADAASRIHDQFNFTIHIPIVFDVPDLPNIPTLPVIPQAAGGDWVVDKPTLFLAGESGTERATFTPIGAARRSDGAREVTVNIAFHGPVLAESDYIETTIAAGVLRGIERGGAPFGHFNKLVSEVRS